MKHINNTYKIIMLGLVLCMTMTFSLSAAPLKIMMIGDSITEGGGHIPDLPDQNQSDYTGGMIQSPNNIAYRGELWTLFKNDGYVFGTDVDFVGNKTSGSHYSANNPGFDENHEGHSGYTSAQIRDGLDSWLATSPADIVLLHIGTNDGAKSMPIGSNGDINQDANTTVNNVKKILNSIFTSNPNAKVFVARIIEARRAEAFSTWRTQLMNDEVENMVHAHAKHANIKMVNMQNGAGMRYELCGTILGDMQPYHVDGTYDYHPNVNGYTKMAAKWFSEIKASGWVPNLSAVDTTSPVITLNGMSTVNLLVGDAYVELGATANDNRDGNISNKIVIVQNNVDLDNEGNYSVTYNVSDTAGNHAVQVTRTIVVRTNNMQWYTYEKQVNTATVTPLGDFKQTIIMAEDGLEAAFVTIENSIALRYKINMSGIEAYISANKNGEVNTGFMHASYDDSTLKVGSTFKAGTHSVMKNISGKVAIETVIKLKLGESFTI